MDTPYVHKPVPLTRVDAQESQAHQYDGRIVSAAILAYIRSFVDGENKEWLQRHMPHIANSYTTGVETHNPHEEDDIFLTSGQLALGLITSPLIKDEATLLQLARKSIDFHMRLPNIVVTDTGHQVTPAGLGSYTSTYFDAKTSETVRARMRSYPIALDIMVGGKDTDQCVDLQYFVSHILTSRGAFGSTIQGSNWHIYLQPRHSLGPSGTQPLLGSSHHSISFASVSLEVQFEATAYERYPIGASTSPAATIQGQAGEVGLSIQARPSQQPTTQPSVIVPSTISLRGKGSVQLVNYPPMTTVTSSDRRVAIIDRNLSITPRKPGCFEVLVYKPGTTTPDRYPVTVGY